MSALSARTFEVTLAFEDGVEKTIHVAEGQSVLSAALDGGVHLENQCQSGSCGTCVARVVEGETVVLTGRASALLPSEFQGGNRLTCSTTVASPVRLHLPYRSDLTAGGPLQVDATVTRLERLSTTVIRLSVELPSDSHLTFESGQYVRLRVPETSEWRSYSMATTAKELPHMEFLVRILAEGAMSGYLRDVCVPGDRILVEGPYGKFVLRPSLRPHLMIAGGTGLAPIMAMLDTLRSARGRKTPVLVCFACMTEGDLYYVDELELRAFWMPTMELRIACTAPTTDDYAGTVGTPVSLIEDGDLGPVTPVAYVCGPPGMIEAARRRLLDAGVREDDIRAEQFLPSAT